MNILRLWRVIGGLADALAGFAATINEANAIARCNLGLAPAGSAPALPLRPEMATGNVNGHGEAVSAGPEPRKRRNGS